MLSVGRWAVSLLSILVVVGGPLSAQQPTFRASVEVVLIDVSVVDPAAFPVHDLSASDFSVTVDGKPRKILTAQFLSHRAPGIDEILRVESGVPPAAAIEAPRVGTGRDVVVAVDEDSLESGDGLLAKRAIGRFIDQLLPTDRVAIVTLPRLPVRIGLTNNRVELFEALARVSPSIVRTRGEYRIGLSEALGVEKADTSAATDLIQRECADKFASATTRNELATSQDLEACRVNVITEARQQAMMGHDRSQRSLDALRRLAGLLSSIPRPKTLVLVSGGFPPPVSPSGFAPVASALAAGQVNLYTLLLPRYQFGTVAVDLSPTPADDDALERFGVENMTSAAGGTLLEVVGEFEPLLDRVAREMSGNYLLGVEVQAVDRDGNPHRVDVKVKRAGVTVRARRQYVIGKPMLAAAAEAPTDAAVSPLEGTQLETGFGQLSYNRILTAARDLEGTGDVYFEVKARSVAKAGGAREVTVDLTIDPRSVYFAFLDGRRVGRLGISVFCGDGKKAIVGQLWQEMNLALKDDTYQRYKDQGIRYTAHVPVTGDPRYAKVVVYDFRSDLVGTMTAKVK
jgi:VWFA-related protein